MHRHDIGDIPEPGHGHDIAHKVEWQLAVERGVDGVGGGDYQNRVAVGRGVDDGLGRTVAASARPVLDNHLLGETLREMGRQYPRQNISRAASSKSYD